MREKVTEFLSQLKKQRFTLDELEAFVKKQYFNMNDFLNEGGFKGLKEEISQQANTSKIEPVQSRKKEHHVTIDLPNHWRLVKEKNTRKWQTHDVIRVSEHLDLRYFLNYPNEQNEATLHTLQRIHSFFISNEPKETLTVEERMYDLFKKEKWLSDKEEKGSKFLKKINLELEDLQAFKFPEPIPYETRNRMPLESVENVLIIENNSFYQSVRRYLQNDSTICDIDVDMIVYARGKQTLANLSYLYSLFEDATSQSYYYVGDIDPEGMSIAIRLIEKYPDLHIQLATDIYRWMLREEQDPPPIGKDQVKNPQHFARFLDFFCKLSDDGYREQLYQLWARNLRIPQEVTNFQKLKEKRWKNYDK